MHNKANIQLKNLEIYKQIVEHMSDSLLILDKNHNIIYANHVFSTLVWYSTKEIIWENKNIFFDFEWETKECKKCLIKSSKELNENIYCETNIKTINWKLIPILCQWTPTINWGIVLNISDLRELRTLQQAEEDLIKINETKDEFISIVWHELRTPMTSIMWYLSMILDWDMWDINGDVRKAIYHSYNSSVRLIKLVNDVLSIWKIDAWKMEYNMEESEIMPLIKSVYKDVYLEVSQKWISLKVDFDEKLDEYKINTDKDKLKQVLLNLLTNAIKFTKSWWKVIIKASKQKNKVRFEIIDTWIWIAEDKLNILFDKFTQVEWSMQRENTSGLWLWLSISKRFIQEFQSEIKIKSELDKWSVFYFDLELIE